MYLVDKSEVVADKHHTAVEVVNGVSEGVYGLHVQVIGRFVHQQQVRCLPRQPGEYNATTLAIRQLTHWTHLEILLLLL